MFLIVVFAFGFGVLFGFAGAVAGFLVGLAISAYYEEVLHIGNPQGPLLFLFTAPIGFLIGLFFGAWKAISNRKHYLNKLEK